MDILLPHKPGVYIMRSRSGEVLYVGKAKDIKNRVSQYFLESNLYSRGWKLPSLLPLISKIDYIIAASERDALVLESRLIKKYQPFFNSDGKDDKSYPYIKITSEDFPRAFTTRKITRDGSTYIGPYPQSTVIKTLIRFLWRSKYAPLRPCKWKFDREHPLAQRKINSCIYYHTGQCPAPCAGKISYEDYRKIVNRFELFTQGDYKELIKKFTAAMNDEAAAMHYEEAAKYRDFIAGLEHMLERIVVAEYKDDKLQTEIENADKTKELAKVLGMKKLPLHIEAFDNSHLQGRNAVGCMVCFINGKKHPRHYRRFKIKSENPLTGGDDFMMMREIVYRRLKALKKEPKEMPDLMLIDGGKGQLSMAQEAARQAGVKMQFISLAEREEEIIVPGMADSIKLERNNPALRLLIEIRDEVHRFAVTYHRLLRDKELLADARKNIKDPEE
ncbi:excinuclease ABC subunit C [Parelusimicrobium proximum]|uniref:excinuclease ABC subunit UvrC n=1 Tax=Parelusimicrobium proximum TaxID=3228953 RepID=UPI003D184528